MDAFWARRIEVKPRCRRRPDVRVDRRRKQSPNFDSQSLIAGEIRVSIPATDSAGLSERRVSPLGDVVRRTLTNYGVCGVWVSGCPRHWQIEPGWGWQVDPSQASPRRTHQEERRAGSSMRCGQDRTDSPSNSGRLGEKGSPHDSGLQSARQGVLETDSARAEAASIEGNG